jgi:Tol biopolymer transport system component
MMKGKIGIIGLITIVRLLVFMVSFGIPGWAQKAKPPKPPAPPADPAIAFVAEKSWGHADLMVMDADGSNQKVLLNGITGAGYGNHDPNWSPDGNWIVFGRTDGGVAPIEEGIYKIKKDGTGLCKIAAVSMTPIWGLAGAPRWSPFPIEGIPPILYFEPWKIFLVDAVCNTGTKIDVPPGEGSSFPQCLNWPTWAPSGLQFAAIAQDPVNYDYDIFIFTLDFDQTGGLMFTPGPPITDTGVLADAEILDIDWGKVYDKLALTVNGDIWVIDLADPANPVNLTNTPTISESEPSWSPLDTQIVFRRNYEIYVMNADGSNLKRLATSAKNVRLRAPDWRRNP